MTAYNSVSESALIELLSSGDHAAFTEIYDRYNGVLYVYTYKKIRDREEAKDLIHELFLYLWNNRENLKLVTSLPAYLFSSARNRIINMVTRQKVAERYIDSFQSFIDSFSASDTDHLLRHNDLNAIIEAEIAALTPRMRQIFELSRKTNLTRKQIAEQLNISEETVKSQMHGALKILKTKLGALFFLLF
jgi:RNA polymerase sigma-70 factor (family 1)